MKVREFEISLDYKGFIIVKKNTKYVRLGLKETKYLFEIFQITLDELENDFIDIFLAENLTDEEKMYMESKFREWGFLENQRELDTARKTKDISKIYLFSVNPESILNKIPKWAERIFSFEGIVAIILFSFIKYFIILKDFESMMQNISNYTLSVKDGWIIFISVVITFALHELAHAMACRYYGGNVKKMGMLLYFFCPAFYCDVSDIYIIANRKASFSVSMAGVCANVLMGNVALLLYYLMGEHYSVLLLIWFSNIGIIIFNLLPIVKLDGYWVMSSLLNITNLMDKSTILFLTCIFDKKNVPKNLSFTRRVVLSSYGFSIFVVRPFFWIYSGIEMQQIILGAGFENVIATVVIIGVIIISLFDGVILIKNQVHLYFTQKNQLLQMI